MSQDLIALQQIRERRALRLIQAGRIQEAIAKLSSIWASLPGAGYQQHEQALGDLIAAYVFAGGQLTEESRWTRNRVPTVARVLFWEALSAGRWGSTHRS
ncbi:endolysin [Xanthomonas oryzae pv. oryzae]|uniref:Endolysin n=2 Tax=Xanthomonas oryzae pv. oryzae TaxID=64187 RepID=Q5GYN3_XANOR|nr:endolysin [Xanthomonas oryzae pv. oryzae KACC 10331]ALZ71558.1 endolysin [Xanthomonas oryzae pv. oryzae]QUW74291.1 endolysin [Xanthomonas oryzae]BAE69540.1 conserved hypothetical protein [Xanthomonas oryzae pv. oryzae MAFF 311018]AOS03053.1 endolysin [Xanthomonas oryzae pv. oryzae]